MKRRTAIALPMALAAAGLARGQAGPGADGRKVLRVAFQIAESGFDPARIIDIYSRTITAHIFEALYAYDPLAHPVKIKPLTAAALPEHSSDFRVWTVRVQPGIFFADDPVFGGKRRELVAQDVVYSLKRVVDPANKAPAVSDVLEQTMLGLGTLRDEALKRKKPFDYEREIEGLKALDRYTLRFKLEQPRPRFVEFLAQSDIFGAVAREVIERYGDDAAAHPVGTGPFRLKSWRRSSQIVLERNPTYRERTYEAEPAADDAEGQAILARLKGRRLPMVDEVQVAIIEEEQPRWLSFLNGDTDMIGTIPGPLPPQFIDLAVPGGKLAPHLARRGVRMSRGLNPDVIYAAFNMDDAVVGGTTPEKVALRRAIALAYDSAREIRNVRKGQAIIAQSRIMPHESGYDPAFKSENGEYSAEKAKALLDLYGYVDRDGDGWRELPDGAPLLLTKLTTPDQLTRKIDEEWKHSMDAIGVRIAFQAAQWPENLKAARAGKFQLWELGSSAAGPDGRDNLSCLFSEELGGQNLARFKSEAFDKLYRRISEIEDGPEREALYLQAKKIEVAYMPYKAIMHRISTDLTYPWLVGFRRPLFWQEWWHVVDLDVAARAKALKQR
jgi:ABC-type transport system substrate-binding protein